MYNCFKKCFKPNAIDILEEKNEMKNKDRKVMKCDKSIMENSTVMILNDNQKYFNMGNIDFDKYSQKNGIDTTHISKKRSVIIKSPDQISIYKNFVDKKLNQVVRMKDKFS